jgi:hypothetical protein
MNGGFFVVLGEGSVFLQSFDSTDGILIPLLSCLVVPIHCFFEIDRHMHANFVEIAHGEFSRGQSSLSRSLGIYVSQFIVLLEDALITAQEPLAYGHFRLWLSLSGSKRVIMQRKCWIEITAEGAEFICSAHLKLSLCKS